MVVWNKNYQVPSVFLFYEMAQNGIPNFFIFCEMVRKVTFSCFIFCGMARNGILSILHSSSRLNYDEINIKFLSSLFCGIIFFLRKWQPTWELALVQLNHVKRELHETPFFPSCLWQYTDNFKIQWLPFHRFPRLKMTWVTSTCFIFSKSNL